MANVHGPCRLPYELITNVPKGTLYPKGSVPFGTPFGTKEYLLSTKDLCGLEYLPKLIEAGVMCFKIEGRMKTPEYVATVTRIYRKYIDLALSNKPYVIDDKDKKDLLQVFNRGGFSNGHFSSEPNRNLVYSKKPNHMGIYLGNVSNIKQNKGHVFINLNDELSIGDTIMFENETSKYTVSELMVKNKNIITANKKQLVEIGRMKGNIKIGDKIYKIASKELSNLAKYSYEGENIKNYLKANILIKKGEPITLTVKTLPNDNPIYKDICVTLTSNMIPADAKSKPTSKEKIINQISKTNNTIFEFKDIVVKLDDNVFIPSISKLNELRRNALEQIEYIAQEKIKRTFESNTSNDINKTISNNIIDTANSNNIVNKKSDNTNYKPEISLLLNNLNENYNYENIENVSRIYIPLKFFASKKYERNIKNICEHFKTYIYIPTIIKSNYFNILNNLIDNSLDKFNIKGFVVSNISCKIFIDKIKKKYKDKFEFIANYTLNVYNNISENTLANFGVETITISPELDAQTINSICNNYKNSNRELIVYGNIPLMSMNYCLLGNTNKCYPSCGTRCKNENCKYYLKDRLGVCFRIIPDSIQTVSTLYNSKITSICGTDFNVDSYRIDIIDEEISEINNIIELALNGKRLEGKDYTNGNLNREI